MSSRQPPELHFSRSKKERGADAVLFYKNESQFACIMCTRENESLGLGVWQRDTFFL